MLKNELWRMFWTMAIGLLLGLGAIARCLLGFDHATSVLLLGIAFTIWTAVIVRIVVVLVKDARTP